MQRQLIQALRSENALLTEILSSGVGIDLKTLNKTTSELDNVKLENSNLKKSLSALELEFEIFKRNSIDVKLFVEICHFNGRSKFIDPKIKAKLSSSSTETSSPSTPLTPNAGLEQNGGKKLDEAWDQIVERITNERTEVQKTIQSLRCENESLREKLNATFVLDLEALIKSTSELEKVKLENSNLKEKLSALEQAFAELKKNSVAAKKYDNVCYQQDKYLIHQFFSSSTATPPSTAYIPTTRLKLDWNWKF
jgi:regulator of replication initiation timing